MTDPAYPGATSPIKQFRMVEPSRITDALNQLIIDINAAVVAISGGNFVGVFTVATLPVSATGGQVAYASDGRKVGEGAGVGTGVGVYYSLGAWRVESTDAPVLS